MFKKYTNCRLPWQVEWHSLTFCYLAFMILRTSYDILNYDVISYKLLTDSKRMQSQLQKAHVSSGELDELVLPAWLRMVACTAPVAGLVAFVVVLSHLLSWLKHNPVGAHARHDDQRDLVILIFSNPMIWVVMAMRSEIRILEVFTGSAYSLAMHTNLTWAQVESRELSTARIDLQVAEGIQYYVIWCFTHFLKSLCEKYFPLELQHFPNSCMANWIYLQGAWLFAILGFISAMAGFGVTVCHADVQQRWCTVWLGELENLDQWLRFPLLATMVLCIVNIHVIGRFLQLKLRLNLKFTAIILLLACEQVQPKILDFVTHLSHSEHPTLFGSSTLGEKGQTILIHHHFQLSQFEAKLLHVSLLLWECLVVSLANVLFLQFETITGDHSIGYWKVVYHSGVQVRESNSKRSKVLGCKDCGELVYAEDQGTWLRLQEGGFMLKRELCTVLLEAAAESEWAMDRKIDEEGDLTRKFTAFTLSHSMETPPKADVNRSADRIGDEVGACDPFQDGYSTDEPQAVSLFPMSTLRTPQNAQGHIGGVDSQQVAGSPGLSHASSRLPARNFDELDIDSFSSRCTGLGHGRGLPLGPQALRTPHAAAGADTIHDVFCGIRDNFTRNCGPPDSWGRLGSQRAASSSLMQPTWELPVSLEGRSVDGGMASPTHPSSGLSAPLMRQ